MVVGLPKFREHFSAYTDRYILIGGVACTLALASANLEFRATRDLDIVLTIEALDEVFATAFWAFIEDGGYQYREKYTGDNSFYRFHTPSATDYPLMLELFSRKLDGLTLAPNSRLTPIPICDGVASLSAILLDDAYYEFINEGKIQVEQLTIINAEHLIPMKVRAWLDLLALKADGKVVARSNIVKHKQDVFSLYQILSAQTRVILPDSIKSDMQIFCDRLERDETIDLGSLGLTNTTVAEAVANLRKIYSLDRSGVA